MRLIDADKLIELLETYQGDIFPSEVIEDINEQPTVDPAKHSTWIPSVPDFMIRTSRNRMCPAETFKCGHCGHEILRRVGYPLPNYCENCGTKNVPDIILKDI